MSEKNETVVAWRRRPKGSDRGWTYFDEAEDLEFYLASGRYEVDALVVASLAQAPIIPNGYKVHMAHCNQGDYADGCKYGEDDTCPALSAGRSALGE